MKAFVLVASMGVLAMTLAPGCGGEKRGDAVAVHKDAASGVSEGAGAPQARRSFAPLVGRQWIGSGICYGPHRDGQAPGGPSPTKAQIREDLHLIAEHWPLLRMYSASEATATALELIREERLPLKLMLGLHLNPEARLGQDGSIVEEYPEARAANEKEVATAIRLANAYPDVVLAVAVGNETQVFWAAHRVAMPAVLGYIQRVRNAVRVPVTTADDFNFWNKPESQSMAREIDFIVMHVHPMWGGQPLEKALPFAQEKYAEVAAAHPGHTIVLGETGWATQKHNEGDQASLIKGEPGEEQQKTFHKELVEWATRERIAHFFFEAFDENWKGGPHPNEVEKHWGLYRADRSPKKAMQDAG